MKSFSLRRVAQYARYHYTVTRFNYLRLIVAIVACPALFGIMQHNIFTSTSILVAIYLFAGISVAVACTHSMRGRGTKIMDGTLPVSPAERYVFSLFNLAVVYPFGFAVISALTLAIVAIFNEFPLTFGDCYMQLINEAILFWPVYVLVQIVCSSSLLINMLARRSLILAYVIAFACNLALICLLAWKGVECNFHVNGTECSVEFGDGALEVTLWAAQSIYIAIPIVLYALGYVALRKRQVKW